MRLAFSVAAHLEPEILIVDEVLAVGDIRFQKKCLSKMDEVARAGRTVLYVAHNMPAISRLCQRAILMGNGRVVQDGPVHEVISTYLNSGLGTSAVREWTDLARAPGGDIVRLCAVRVLDQNGEIPDAIDIRRPLRIETETRSSSRAMCSCPISTCPTKKVFVFSERRIWILNGEDDHVRQAATSAPSGCRATCWPKGWCSLTPT